MNSVQQVLAEIRERLRRAGIPDAGLEAQVLAMHAAAWDRTRLLSSLREPFLPECLERLEALAKRREAREPLAYITGHREFYGLDLMVDKRVLVPRQETECLVEQALRIAIQHYEGAPNIGDVGTGSGAIAIALATALPLSHIFACDTSQDALDVCDLNVRRHGLDATVTLHKGDLLAALPSDVEILAANLPYIPASDWPTLQPEIRLHEPKSALVSGERGLDAVCHLLLQVQQQVACPEWIVLELGTGQAKEVIDFARTLFPAMEAGTFRDLGGLERGVVLTGFPPPFPTK